MEIDVEADEVHENKLQNKISNAWANTFCPFGNGAELSFIQHVLVLGPDSWDAHWKNKEIVRILECLWTEVDSITKAMQIGSSFRLVSRMSDRKS